MPLVRRTRAILRSAELGFLGVIVETRVQTPRRCGAPCSAGVLVFSRLELRPLRINWLTVGIGFVSLPGPEENVVVTHERPARAEAPPNQTVMVAERHGQSNGRAAAQPAAPDAHRTFALHAIRESWNTETEGSLARPPRTPTTIPLRPR